MVKIISLSDEAYKELKMMKREGESFSKVVKRVVAKENTRTFLELAGAWKKDKEIGKIFKKVLEERRTARFRY